MNDTAGSEDSKALVAPQMWQLWSLDVGEQQPAVLQLVGGELVLRAGEDDSRRRFPVRSIALARWDSAQTRGGPMMAAALLLEGDERVRIGCAYCRLRDSLLQHKPVERCDYRIALSEFVELLMALSAHRASPLPRPSADPYRERTTTALAPVELFVVGESSVSMRPVVIAFAVLLLCVLVAIWLPPELVVGSDLALPVVELILVLVAVAVRFAWPVLKQLRSSFEPTPPEPLQGPRRGKAVLAIDRERVWLETSKGGRVAEAGRVAALAGARDVEEWQQDIDPETGLGHPALVKRMLAITLETTQGRTLRVFTHIAEALVVDFAEKGSPPACHEELEIDASEAERLVEALRGRGQGV